MPSGSSAETLYLVDAHALIFQVFHAIPEMTSPSGLPTNALFGFTRDLLFLRTEKKPTYLVVAFDVPGKTFREDLYPEYKANRSPMPVDLTAQIPEVYTLLEAMNVPVLGLEGYEADDVIATVATEASRRGVEVFICTSDKDCRQLIDDRVCLYNLRKHQAFDRAALLADWGITPEQVVDLQSMVGDSVDNIKGVPGIGVKTAAKLLQEFGTVDRILANVDKISGAKRKAELLAAGPTVERNRPLVRLKTDVPVPLEWDRWRLGDWDAARLLELFQKWGFRRFADLVRPDAIQKGALPTAVVAPTQDDPRPSQGELFPFGANVETANADALPAGENPAATTGEWRASYQLVDTPERFDGFLKALATQRRFAIDLETTSLEPRRADIVGLAFSWKEGEAWYLPVRGPEADAKLPVDETLKRLRGILEDPAIEKVNQNIKYDWIVFRQHGIQLAGVAGDPMVADYLLHAGERSHSMEVLSSRYLNHQVIPITDLIGPKGKRQLRMDQVATARVAEYSGEDADVAFRLAGRLEPELASRQLRRLYDELEIPLIAVLGDLEFNGIRLDLPLLERTGLEMGRQLAELEKEIHGLAGHEFNIASLRQLRQVLFEELKLPVQRKTGITGEPSTDQETLERLAALGYELPQKILVHRQIAKLKGTYVDALPQLVNPQTGRVHASFNQTVAATGRLSSSDPNLQNIPIRSDIGGQIRQAFIPEAGWQLLTADYSQIELRLLAHFSGDAAMRQAFIEKRDIHALVAAQIFSVAEAAVNPEMRRVAKTVNFGVIYGMSAHGLAQRLGMPREEAGRFIDAYFARYPAVAGYQSQLLETARQRGFVGTILGRRRDITGIRANTSYQQRNQPEREAVNMEIQGSAADLIKRAMVRISRRLKDENRRTRMLLQIHDELVFEAPPEEMEPVCRLVRDEMVQAIPLDVPLEVDLSAGPNWLDLVEVDG